ncbi:hypothetical protein F-S17_0130 [Faustovirus]|nr:hypothetical protein F-S17_0130 [Faustovirus]
MSKNMDYNLKGKSPGVVNRLQNSPRVGVLAPVASSSPRTQANTLANTLANGGVLQPKMAATAATGGDTAANGGKKSSTDAEIKEKLTGYVQVEQPYWGRLPVGTHIRYFAQGTSARNVRFRTGGFIVSWTKSANGKVYLKIANKLEFTNRQAGYRDFSVDTTNIAEIWAKPEIVDKVKNEQTPTDLIKQLVDEIAALKARVAALERVAKK